MREEKAAIQKKKKIRRKSMQAEERRETLCLKRSMKGGKEAARAGGWAGRVLEVHVRGLDFILCEMGMRSILNKGGTRCNLHL